MPMCSTLWDGVLRLKVAPPPPPSLSLGLFLLTQHTHTHTHKHTTDLLLLIHYPPSLFFDSLTPPHPLIILSTTLCIISFISSPLSRSSTLHHLVDFLSIIWLIVSRPPARLDQAAGAHQAHPASDTHRPSGARVQPGDDPPLPPPPPTCPCLSTLYPFPLYNPATLQPTHVSQRT